MIYFLKRRRIKNFLSLNNYDFINVEIEAQKLPR